MRDTTMQEHIGKHLITMEEGTLHIKQCETCNYIIAHRQQGCCQQCNTVCYDNIEIPTSVIHELRTGTKAKKERSTIALLNAVVDSADSIILAMNEKGIPVERVTTGKGYNTIATELEERFGSPETPPKALHRNYTGYTDADGAQYVIRTYKQTTKRYAETIYKAAKEVLKDLNAIQAAKNNVKE